jgi:hypothetical protein
MLSIPFLAACACWLVTATDLGREPDGVVYSPHQAFRIPLDLTPEERQQISAVRLFVSEDEGKTWVLHSDGATDMKIITFRATRDGTYWFSIALVDHQGQQMPADIRTVEPGLRVVVDTLRPEMNLKPVKTKSGKRGIRWEITDENIVPGSLQLAAFENETTGWKPLEIRHPENAIAWFTEGSDVQKVQALLVDRAGNKTVVQVDIHGDRFARHDVDNFALAEAVDTAVATATPIPNADPAGFPPSPPVQKVDHRAPTEHTVASPTQPAPSDRTVCKSNHVVVNYEIDGNSPDAKAELWGTKDRGVSWSRLSIDEDRKSPIEAKLDQEGTWGLMIVVASKDNYHPPAPGATPEVYIEVDTVSPFVEIMPPHVQTDQVILKWNAVDKNFGKGPIDILYSTSAEGPWNVAATEMDNTGEFIWNYTRAGVSGDMYFRIEAVDLAGNVGAGMTSEPVSVGVATTATKAKVLGIQSP